MSRESPDAPAHLPAGMQPLVDGYVWTHNAIGESGASVYRLLRPGSSSLYLKHGHGVAARDITDETVRLRWLAGRLPAPAVRHFVASPDEAWLLMTALPGHTAREIFQTHDTDPLPVVDALAAFLRRLHALPIETCPFNSHHGLRLTQAKERLAAGLVDTADFDGEHAGLTVNQVWDEMISQLPMSVDSVVTHGDFTLDNVLIHAGEVAGCIDVARLGVADRYQDLAILGDNLRVVDAALQQRLFERYGITDPDPRKSRFHLALDEYF